MLRATTAFQKAEVLMKRNNAPAALEEARKAVELDPSQADYIALLAWLESNQLNANLDEILARIEKAQRLEPNNTRIRWYRGSILKRMGKSGKAIGDFRFIVENDPRHVDAQRETRLYEMRKAEQRRTGQKTPSDRPSAQPRSSGAPRATSRPTAARPIPAASASGSSADSVVALDVHAGHPHRAEVRSRTRRRTGARRRPSIRCARWQWSASRELRFAVDEHAAAFAAFSQRWE